MKIYPAKGFENLLERCQLLHSPQITGATQNRLYDLNPNTFNNGVFTGFTGNSGWVGEETGTAVKFTGANSVRVANSTEINLVGPLTIMAWVKYTLGQGNTGIFVKWGDFGQYGLFTDVSVNTRLAFAIRSVGTTYRVVSNRAYNDGRWHLMVGIYDRQNVILNIDGGQEIVVGPAVNTDITTTTQGLWYGSWTNGGAAFAGTVGEGALFDTAITHTDLEKYFRIGQGMAWQLEPPRKRSYFAQVLTTTNRNKSSRYLCFPG